MAGVQQSCQEWTDRINARNDTVDLAHTSCAQGVFARHQTRKYNVMYSSFQQNSLVTSTWRLYHSYLAMKTLKEWKWVVMAHFYVSRKIQFCHSKMGDILSRIVLSFCIHLEDLYQSWHIYPKVNCDSDSVVCDNAHSHLHVRGSYAPELLQNSKFCTDERYSKMKLFQPQISSFIVLLLEVNSKG